MFNHILYSNLFMLLMDNLLKFHKFYLINRYFRLCCILLNRKHHLHMLKHINHFQLLFYKFNMLYMFLYLYKSYNMSLQMDLLQMLYYMSTTLKYYIMYILCFLLILMYNIYQYRYNSHKLCLLKLFT